jgi:hypothetical protein
MDLQKIKKITHKILLPRTLLNNPHDSTPELESEEMERMIIME